MWILISTKSTRLGISLLPLFFLFFCYIYTLSYEKKKGVYDMITIEIQSLIIGMICAYAVSCVVKVWKEKYEHARETKTDTKKAKSNDGKVAEQ